MFVHHHISPTNIKTYAFPTGTETEQEHKITIHKHFKRQPIFMDMSLDQLLSLIYIYVTPKSPPSELCVWLDVDLSLIHI